MWPFMLAAGAHKLPAPALKRDAEREQAESCRDNVGRGNALTAGLPEPAAAAGRLDRHDQNRLRVSGARAYL